MTLASVEVGLELTFVEPLTAMTSENSMAAVVVVGLLDADRFRRELRGTAFHRS